MTTSLMTAIAWVGGILSVLTLIHFIADWIFQSHAEAMAKSSDAKVRAKHCLVYTGIITLILIAGFHIFNVVELLAYAAILWLSHFIEDSYMPVFLWAKYIRKAPEFSVPSVEGTHFSDLDRFKEFASTPLGKILLIVVDQIIHIIYLGFIAIMLRLRGTVDFWYVFGITMGTIGVLAVLAQSAKAEILRSMSPEEDAHATH